MRIAGTEVKDMDHLNVVDVLKSCPQGKPTEIVVRRGGKLFTFCNSRASSNTLSLMIRKVVEFLNFYSVLG